MGQALKKSIHQVIILPALALALALAATPTRAEITVTWLPGEVVEGTPVDEWLLFCANVTALYPAPIIIPEADRAHTFTVPDGSTKCKMRSRSINHIWGGAALDSDDSIEITFLVAGGVRIDPRPNPPTLAVN